MSRGDSEARGGRWVFSPVLPELLGLVLFTVLVLGFIPLGGGSIVPGPLFFLLVLLVRGTVRVGSGILDAARRTSWGRGVRLWFDPSAFLALIALFLPRGLLTAMLVLPWLLYLLAQAAVAGLRWRERASRGTRALFDPAELCLDAALLYLVPGGAFLLIWTSGWQGLPFTDTIVFYTAVHFHAIPVGALVPAALVGELLRDEPRRIRAFYGGAAAFVIAGPALVAAGFLRSEALKTTGVVVLAAGLLAAAWLVLMRGLPHLRGWLPKALIVVWALAVPLGMGLALAWQIGLATEAWFLSIEFMLWSHGLIQAFGLGLCGVLAFRLHHGRAGTFVEQKEEQDAG